MQPIEITLSAEVNGHKINEVEVELNLDLGEQQKNEEIVWTKKSTHLLPDCADLSGRSTYNQTLSGRKINQARIR